ncbi:acetyl-CoA carboxylase [Arthrobacter mobilis]|uniref:Biotin carboxyl carrier protein of acetyl-CoA carboxylase n=1 Tax=Arthrobacter mobilis TaxID=2724944 RepID=A0A7X6K5R3_9MICC|nr:acetyl-CoA carboxylase [Arthrobacter mobilis]NKX56050.1 biotin carboxyl carrier domain-containing protein [Arthrobacter mobilis]
MAEILSPLPGIFYRRPGPDKDPYVKEGDRVDVGQTVGVVEVMKQFTEVRSDAAGTLDRFHIEDAGTVNPGDVIATVSEG